MLQPVLNDNFNEFIELGDGIKLVIGTEQRQVDWVFLSGIYKIGVLQHNSIINFDRHGFDSTYRNDPFDYFYRGVLGSRPELIENFDRHGFDSTYRNDPFDYFYRGVLGSRPELIENRRSDLGDNPFEIGSFDNTYQSDMSKNIGIVLECIDNLSEIDADLDEYNSLPPDNECITNAKGIVIDLITEIYSNNLSWIDPYISCDEEGCILIEWYNDDRQLHIEINDVDAEYITFFRTDTYSEMHDGNFNNKNYMLHWKWLINEQ